MHLHRLGLNGYMLSNQSLGRKGLMLMGALAVVARAMTFPGLAGLVFALGLEVVMFVAVKCVRERVILRVPRRGRWRM